MITREMIDSYLEKSVQRYDYTVTELLYEIVRLYNNCETEIDYCLTALVSKSHEIYSKVLELQECLDVIAKTIKLICENASSPLAQLSMNTLVVALGDLDYCCQILKDVEENEEKDVDLISLDYQLYCFSCLFDDKKSKKGSTMTREEFLTLEDNSETTVSFEDFLVRTNVFRCNKNHSIETINAIVNVLQSNGEISRVNITAGYCDECKVYFILEHDYLKLRKQGAVLCQQITYETYISRGDVLMSGLELKKESILHQCGYNVSATENLSREQRRGILRMVIDKGLYNVNGLCSHLDWLIDRNSRSTNKDMSSAISKWQDDRDYIASYKSDDVRSVWIKSIKRKLH